MNVFKNTKMQKKFIFLIILLMIFSFCYPKQVHAGNLKSEIAIAPCKLIYQMEWGILKFMNNIFCDQDHHADKGIYLSPESIIKGKFVLLEPNIFKKIEGGDYYYDNNIETKGEVGTSIAKGKNQLRDVISGWYYALRNLAIVALLSVLVYVGIRMMMTSISQDKAKYKTMLKDWFIALCLLFGMHYIMLGLLNISSMITQAIGTDGESVNFIDDSIEIIEGVINSSEDDHSFELEGQKYDIPDAYAQLFVLAGIIGYTVIFALKYLKRMITIIFLILLAPISCITYPIDKISDGKAQAYNMWFQEFLYQVIIQPFHLLIYVVLVGSATTLASTNVLYGIMCFAVMIPAEKFIKQMFGFKDKLSSPLGAFATGAIASNLLKSKGGSPVSKDKPNTSGGNDSIKDKSPKSNQIEKNTDSDAGKNKYDNENQENELEPWSKTNMSKDEYQEKYENEVPWKSDENRLPENSPDTANANDQYTYLGQGDDTSLDDPNYMYMHPEQYDTSNTANNKGIPENNNKQEEATNTNTTQEPKHYTAKEKAGQFFNAARSKRDKQLIGKYGTKNRGIVARKKLKNGAIRTIKGATGTALRTAGALAVGATTGLVGAMFGQGGKAFAAGAAVGNKIGGKVSDGINSTVGNAAELAKAGYRGAQPQVWFGPHRGEDREDLEKIRNYRNNTANIEKAEKIWAKHHNGIRPNTKELNSTLEKMYDLEDNRMPPALLENAIPMLDEKTEKNKADGMNDTEAYKSALNEVSMAGELGGIYGPKELKDQKKVQNFYDTQNQRYEDAEYDEASAAANTKRDIENVGRLYDLDSASIAKPKQSSKLDYMSDNKVREMVKQDMIKSGKTKVTHKQVSDEMEKRYETKSLNENMSEEDITSKRHMDWKSEKGTSNPTKNTRQSKPTSTKPTSTKPTETKSTETKSTQPKPSQNK